MKILVFSDIHGSLNGLKELLKSKDYNSADRVIFLGDVAFGASRPNECIELLNNSKAVCLLGNNDSYICYGIPNSELDEFGAGKLKQYEYMDSVISLKSKQDLKSWQRELYISIDGKKLYFTHYPWERDELGDLVVIDDEKFASLANCQKMFADVDADYIFFGHEHRAYNFSDKNKNFYCLDTFGLKKQGNYLMIRIEDGHLSVEEKSLEFDIAEEIKLMDKAGYPYDKKKIKKD